MEGSRASGSARFDADYYRRFYHDPRTRVADLQQVESLGRFVGAYLDFLGLRVRSVLDLGCGVGHWRTVLTRILPGVRYRGVEYSEYLCEELGWERGSAVDYSPGRTFDLVICQGVLQYLSDRDAARAINNLGRLCRGALYLEALTRKDLRENCDRSATDGKVHLRTGDWYRSRLRKWFHNCGGGLFLARSAAVTTFELETLS